MTWFIIDTTYTDDRDLLQATRPAHRDYLRALVDRGVVVGAGPWGDDLGGMFIAAVADRAELDAVLAADPYTTEGVVARQVVREWKPVLGRIAQP
ncbi:YciI family protein [Actinokineospora bangkokensis]|uniref:YCII-related domain-containing protein n=1 Tax=Actinokineospora bangkokensis TaxID=1193682 RepID=A0A1Q9LFY3_9PSEU|nr:YciI family protein [Actinokineospora bangkokensis]OLR90924.1 hypothetical protein BJP25_30680 [Actinokineospora bangkokensis]